jgi:hypothetical protein
MSLISAFSSVFRAPIAFCKSSLKSSLLSGDPIFVLLQKGTPKDGNPINSNTHTPAKVPGSAVD